MKVLNLYAGIGGNRALWTDCEVTAVELDHNLGWLYHDRFPQDNTICGDAHEYLLKNYHKFDFIWSSPPCPTHSRARFWGSKGGQCDVKYPDLKLYEEILLLKHFFKGKWVVENVIPYYEPLIHPTQQIGKHNFWSNFIIPKFEAVHAHYEKQEEIEKFHGIDLSKYEGDQPRKKIARNTVHYETGKKIFDIARNIYVSDNSAQTTLF